MQEESQLPSVTTTSEPSVSSKPAWNPKDYQKRAIQLLLSQASGGLFLDPGLGKTSVVLATIKILKAKGLITKTLVVAPLRPMYKVWPDEMKKWKDFEGMTYQILHGRTKEWALRQEADVYIINPEGLLWLFAPTTKHPNFDVLVIDESSKFKDAQTKRFKLLKPWLAAFKRRWILTGTPAPNGLEDLFGQIYILDLGRSLGRFITHYRREFFQQSGYNLYDWRPIPGAFEKVVDRISPLILQLSAEDYLEMPELVYRTISVSLPTAAKKFYDEVEEYFIAKMDDETIIAANAAVAGVKCRQVANGAVYNADGKWTLIHDEKLDALEDLLEELGGKPVLLLYEFDHDRARIEARLGSIPCLSSGMAIKEMERTIDRFNLGEIPVLLGHPASMGHGLNLQNACHHAIWFGITWNLEYYDQAIARIYRQGQENSRVFVYHIVAKDTLDEKVLNVLQEKDKTQQGLLTALSNHRKENYDV